MSDMARSPAVPTLNVLSFNCWGLKYISTHRRARLLEIGAAIASATPKPDIVALQECWVLEDYHAIRSQTRHILPYGKFYHSGVFGSGLVILTRWPLLETSMYQYPLNGRPTAFFRGDWFVGKGIASARIEVPHADCRLLSLHPSDSAGHNTTSSRESLSSKNATTTMTILNTHLHAPYEPPHRDTYACHRTAQALALARSLLSAREKGHLAIALGDFNMVPDSLAYRLVTAHGGVEDAWRAVKPDAQVETERCRVVAQRLEEDAAIGTRRRMSESEARIRTVGFSLEWEGLTCDSAANTWRWDKKRRRALERGSPRNAKSAVADRETQLDAHDPWAKRLDYVFVGQPVYPAKYMHPDKSQDRSGAEWEWHTMAASVGMTQRHSRLHCSLSDHFSIAATLTLLPTKDRPPLTDEISTSLSSSSTNTSTPESTLTSQSQPQYQPPLPPQTYTDILALTHSYISRQTAQRQYRLTHFALSIVVAIACYIAVWWSPHNGVAFALILLASLGLAAGVLDGLIGGIFGGSEMSALREFVGEVERLGGLTESEATDDHNNEDRPG